MSVTETVRKTHLTYNCSCLIFAIFTSIEDETKNTEQDIEEDVQAQLSNTFEAIPSTISIGGIVEKIPTEQKAPELQFSPDTGFPRAKRRDVSNISFSIL